jgi:hypothetical protein
MENVVSSVFLKCDSDTENRVPRQNSPLNKQ